MPVLREILMTKILFQRWCKKVFNYTPELEGKAPR